MNANLDAAVQSWLVLNNPVHIKNIKSSSKLLALATVSDTDTTIAPSMACLTGSGAEAAKSNSDWATNPLLGAVNCAQMARVAAGYNPTTLDQSDATKDKYNDFLDRITKCPLYEVKMSERQKITRTSSNWNQLIDAISDTFEGIADKDKSSIVSGLKNLAQAASSKMETNETQAVFVQNAMNVDGVISFYLYSTNTTFYEKKGKGYDMKQSSFEVVKLRMEFQSDLWPQYWETVKKVFDGKVNDWLNDNTTSTAGTKPIPAFNS